MDYTLSLTRQAAEALCHHLLSDRSREQMAITLCGVNRMHRELRLLVRDVVLLPPDAFRRQDAAHLELKQEVQAFVHQRAYRQGLIQVDWHSHPGQGSWLSFSPIDDHHEAEQAVYLAHRMDGVPYGSVVINDRALDARLWLSRSRQSNGTGTDREIVYRPQVHPMRAVHVGDLAYHMPLTAQRAQGTPQTELSQVFDRQVRAFGQEVQHRLGRLRVGVVGLGGLGSALVDHLARLGVGDWVLVDPDVVELTNLNRLVNATLTDAQKARPKVNVARSTVRQANPKAHVRALQIDVLNPKAQQALKTCDLLLIATDNHSSRMALNRLAAQYLIPLVHVGFNISVEERRDATGGQEKRITDVSGEYAIPDLGHWCLQCAGIVDPQQAGWELAPAFQRAALLQRGYVQDTPAAAVRHLDGVVASLAAAEIHNLVQTFKPQHRYLAYDALRTELISLKVPASHDCPVCSPETGVLGLGDLEPLPDYRRAGQVLLPPPDVARLADRATPPDAARPQAAPVGQLSSPGQSLALAERSARVQRLQAALDEGDLHWN